LTIPRTPASAGAARRHSIRELTTGSTFANRYQVIEELGKGGMGKVYKVFDTKIKEKIAEQQGDKKKDADPGLAEVEEARKRLSALNEGKK